MKLLILILFSGFVLSSFSQEIEHKHSIHHAFIENKGQWDENILFKTHFQGGNLWVQQGKILFHLQDYSAYQKAHGNFMYTEDKGQMKQDVVHLNFAGANKITNITKGEATQEYYNYFLGNDETKWTSEVRGYHEATLHELYNGIDLKLIEEEEQLKYEFHVAPHGDPNHIKLNYEGYKNISIDKEGNLIVSTKLGNIRENKPYAYQIVNGKIKAVNCSFEVKKGNVNFKLGNYDKKLPLVIDPVLIFATFSGSVTDNFGMTATYGHDGTAYSGGTVYGNSYPTPDNGAYNISSFFTVPDGLSYGITDVFVSKYSSDGSTMIWTSFIGGGTDYRGTETIHSMICDNSNNVYFFGATSSPNFPTVNGYQSVHGGGQANLDFYQNGVHFREQGTDIYVSKLSSNGHQLLASTFIGGSGNDGVNYRENLPYILTVNGFGDTLAGGIYSSISHYDSLTTNYGDQFRGEVMLDPDGNCLVASCTHSTNFPVLNAVQPTIGGHQDGVIFKLSSDLSTLKWSSYFGGSSNDACYSVKIDSSLNVVFSGGTSSPNLSGTAGAWQSTYNGGKADGFVSKLNPAGNVLQRTSYVGANNYDQAFFVEIDRDDNVYLLGQSAGGNFPVVNATYSNPGSSQFMVKLTPDLSTNQHSTVFGNGSGAINISPSAFLVDYCGNIYVSGWGANILQNTMLSGMPVTGNAFQPNSPNGFDFYLMVLERNFSGLLYGTYMGGANAREHVDGGTSRFDKNGVVYQSVCGGCGGQSDFPTSPNAWSNNNLSSNCNNVIFKFDFEIVPFAEFTANHTEGCAALEITFNNTSTETDTYLWDFGDGNVDSTTFNPTITYINPGQYEVFLYVTDSICHITDTAMITITVYDSLMIDVPDNIQLCVPTEITLTGNGFGAADQFLWSSTNQFTDQLNDNLNDSTLTITPSGSTYYFFRVSNADCSMYDSVFVEFTSSALEFSGDTNLCAGDQSLITVTNLNPNIQFEYVWGPSSIIASQPNETSVYVNPATTQYLHITASASNGCLIEDSILINVSNLGNLNIVASASETIVLEGSTVVLTGQPASGYTYSWTPTTGVGNPSNSQTNAVVEQTTTYTLTVSDNFCAKSDTVQVKVLEFVCGTPFVFIPNAFSPNADGDNDVLYVRSILVEKMLFRVFDRWGEMVFESTSTTDGWNGTFRGKACDPDVYDYYLEATCVGGQESLIKGNVTLLK